MSATEPAKATSTVTTDGNKTRERSKSGDGTVRVGGATIRSTKTKENAHKKASGCGGKKFEWSDATNDGTVGPMGGALDAGDPMYSSGGDDDNYILVSGEFEDASARFCAERSKVQIGPKYTLLEFKRRLDVVLDELYSSGDVDEFLRSVEELGCPEFAFVVVKRGVSKAVDLQALQRELTSRALCGGVAAGLLKAQDVARGFERLFETIGDLVLDAPGAETVVCGFLVRCVVDEALPPAYLMDRVFAALGGDIVSRARRLLSREHAGAKLERLWGPGDGRRAAELKVVIDQILGEFCATRDVAEAVKCVGELEAKEFGHEVLKRAVTFSLAKDEATQIAVSLLLKALTSDATPLISAQQSQKGFLRLREALQDLQLDVPHAKDVLDAFERRAAEVHTAA